MTTASRTELSPLQQAEQARQVVGVLKRMEQRFTEGRWEGGHRFGPHGTCLIGGIDEATRWVLPGVAEAVTRELADRLPTPLRAIAARRPRLALAMYNDTFGGRDGAVRLVREAREALGGLPMPVRATTEAGAEVSTDAPAVVIDVREVWTAAAR